MPPLTCMFVAADMGAMRAGLGGLADGGGRVSMRSSM